MRNQGINRLVSSLVAGITALGLLVGACSDPTTVPGPRCGTGRERAAYCKGACASDSLCSGGDQAACEEACQVCEPDDNYCPPAVETP